ncbi:MAG: NADH-quinone oxidoreductase subunit L [Acidobacteria bacterium]|nr:NADH-quinone oxidoreductase subunit L [Acidobacteriota bacterium]
MPASFLDAVWLVPLLPATSAWLMLLVGRRLSRPAISWLCCGTVFGSFLISVGIFRELLRLPEAQRLKEVVLFTWVPSMPMLTELKTAATFRVEWGYLVDPLSAVMILVVTGVGFLIHVYSVGYMAHEGGYYRYFGYLNLFMFMMLTLVLANTFLLMFVGWEGVGLCSYLLIGFWFLKKSAADAGKKAFVVNRVGDAGFLLGVLLVATTFGSLRFVDVNAALATGQFMAGTPAIVAITLCLFIGATGKSAQLPLYVWLPDAMEGPTPVSALIHAATMVTAGVYMVARANGLYQLAPQTLLVVGTVGALTAIYAASMGMVQNDIKRVLAYSTISQLGYMFLACGMGAFAAGIFHLSTHAYFKALLFLGSGAVIHALAGEQDIRKMGGLWGRLPITAKTFFIAALAIAGIPPLAGFFSKDEILWRTFANDVGHPLSVPMILWGVGTATALMTAFYMFRLVSLTFWGQPRMSPEVEHHVHEAPRTMTVPLVILTGLSIVGGWVGIPAVLGGGNRFEHFLAPVFAPRVELAAGEHSHALEFVLMLLAVVVGLLGIVLAYFSYLKRPEIPGQLVRRFSELYRLVYNKYYVDEIYSRVFVEGPVLGKAMGSGLAGFDLRVVDGLGVDGSAWLTRFTSRLSIWWDTWIVDGAVNLLAWGVWVLNWPTRALQTGQVQRYALWMAAGVALLLFYYVQRYILGS